MKISLLHPSRERALKAKSTYDYWMENAFNKSLIEHILSIDISDPQMSMYRKLFTDSIIIINDNTNVVEATNHAAKESKGEIIVYMSDDFKCPKHWDLLLRNAFSTVTAARILCVDDCLRKFETPIITMPIMNRKLYELLGYFWNPLYKSMFVDEDLYWTCKRRNFIINARSLKFPHEHWSNGKAEVDDTYRKTEANWKQGEEMFKQRKIQGFKI